VLQAQSSRLDIWSHRIGQAASGRTGRDRLRLQALAHRISLAADSAIERRRLPLQGLSARLDAAHPRQVLQRGYAWVTDGAGKPVLRAAALHPGQEVRAVFSDGLAAARVDTVRLTEAGPDGLAPDR
jgi:exodeoxyribonuclease VII large subunit